MSLLLFFVAIDLDRGFWTVTLAHTTLTMCFVTVVVQARLVTFDRSLEEAAMDLGAPPLRAFLSVTLPLIAPVDRAGLPPRLHALPRRPRHRELQHRTRRDDLPMRIYSQVRLGVSPEINAASTLLIGFVTLGVVAAALLTKRSARAQHRP